MSQFPKEDLFADFFTDDILKEWGVESEKELKYYKGSFVMDNSINKEHFSNIDIGHPKNFDTNVAISTTGIAGPDGGTIDKPVGLVYIGIYINGKTTVNKYILKGNREDIRLRATKKAINDLRLRLLEL